MDTQDSEVQGHSDALQENVPVNLINDSNSSERTHVSSPGADQYTTEPEHTNGSAREVVNSLTMQTTPLPTTNSLASWAVYLLGVNPPATENWSEEDVNTLPTEPTSVTQDGLQRQEASLTLPALADAPPPLVPVPGHDAYMEPEEFSLSPYRRLDNELDSDNSIDEGMSPTSPLPQSPGDDSPWEIAATLNYPMVMRATVEFRNRETVNGMVSRGVGTPEARQRYLWYRSRRRSFLPLHQQPLITLPSHWTWSASPTIQYDWKTGDNELSGSEHQGVYYPPLLDDPAHFQVRSVDTYLGAQGRSEESTHLSTLVRDWWFARLQAGRPIPQEVLTVLPVVAHRTTQEERHALDTVAAFNYRFRNLFWHHLRNEHGLSLEANAYEILVPSTGLYPTTFTEREYGEFMMAELRPNSEGFPRDDLVHASPIITGQQTWDYYFSALTTDEWENRDQPHHAIEHMGVHHTGQP
jgi:hypothetical protein